MSSQALHFFGTREKSLSFAAAKKRKALQPAVVSKMQKTNKIEQLELFQSELEKIIKVRTQRAILRCKIKRYNKGEKKKTPNIFFVLRKDTSKWLQ